MPSFLGGIVKIRRKGKKNGGVNIYRVKSFYLQQETGYWASYPAQGCPVIPGSSLAQCTDDGSPGIG